MDKISEKLNIINNAKEDIKTAIENKGVVVGNDSIETYADKIDEMQVAGFEINNYNYLFYGNARLNIMNDLLKFCKNVGSCDYMFYNATQLTEIDLSNFDYSLKPTMHRMFYGCTKLSKIIFGNNAKTKDSSYLFSGCTVLENVDLSNFDISESTDLQFMFNNCKKFTKIEFAKVPNRVVLSLANTFYSCGVVDLDMSNIYGDKLTSVSACFSSCSNLTNLSFLHDLGKGFTQKTSNYSSYKLDLHYATKLTHDSLMDVINKLYDLNLTYDVANGGTLYTQQLVLGSTNLAKLTADEIAIATNKGWVVS